MTKEILDLDDKKAPKPRFKSIYILLLFILAFIVTAIGFLFRIQSWEGGSTIFYTGIALIPFPIILIVLNTRDKGNG